MSCRLGIVRDPIDGDGETFKNIRKYEKFLDTCYRDLFAVLIPLPSLIDIKLGIE